MVKLVVHFLDLLILGLFFILVDWQSVLELVLRVGVVLLMGCHLLRHLLIKGTILDYLRVGLDLTVSELH